MNKYDSDIILKCREYLELITGDYWSFSSADQSLWMPKFLSKNVDLILDRNNIEYRLQNGLIMISSYDIIAIIRNNTINEILTL